MKFSRYIGKYTFQVISKREKDRLIRQYYSKFQIYIYTEMGWTRVKSLCSEYIHATGVEQ